MCPGHHGSGLHRALTPVVVEPVSPPQPPSLPPRRVQTPGATHSSRPAAAGPPPVPPLGRRSCHRGARCYGPGYRVTGPRLLCVCTDEEVPTLITVIQSRYIMGVCPRRWILGGWAARCGNNGAERRRCVARLSFSGCVYVISLPSPFVSFSQGVSSSSSSIVYATSSLSLSRRLK